MHYCFRLSLFTSMLTSTLQLALCQTVPLTNPAREDTPQTVPRHFVCDIGYTHQQCHEQMSVLRLLLDKYGAARLGRLDVGAGQVRRLEGAPAAAQNGPRKPGV